MKEPGGLAAEFELNRPRLRGVAYRMLGSMSAADDAVQESWLRLSRADADQIENLGGWLTTVVSRVCLDTLRARRSHREVAMPPEDVEPWLPASAANALEDQALVDDAVGQALLIVLDRLTPAERVAFVLHDVFAVPFSEIAPILERSPTATRQLASRARRRVRGGSATLDADARRRGEVVRAFLAASRGGDFSALLAVLDPGATLRADAAAIDMGATAPLEGASDVAELFFGGARAARLALINGEVGLLWQQGGRARVAFLFTVTANRVSGIDLVADKARLGAMDLVVLERGSSERAGGG